VNHGREIVRLPRDRVGELVDLLRRTYRVAGPVRVPGEERWTFRVLDPGELPDLSYRTTLLPLRRLVVPPRDVLFRFRREADGSFSFEEPGAGMPLALVGVHGCDLLGLRVHRSFHETTCIEQPVLERLDRALVIAVGCFAPCGPSCFCRDTGALENRAMADLYAWDLGETYLVEVLTRRGRNVVGELGGLEGASPEEMVLLRRRIRARLDAFPLHLGFPLERLGRSLEAAEDDLLWEANADRCLSCGRCNLVCPTCTCFDVRDCASLDGHEGERARTWTGCQAVGFSRVAGGHDFRPTRAQQLRYRVFRKGKYMPERYGLVGCTGCGRCVEHCPVGISIREIFRQVGGGA